MEWAVIVAIYLAGVASGYTIKLVVDIRSNKNVANNHAAASNGSVAQSGNTAGGHIAGGDITTRGK